MSGTAKVIRTARELCAHLDSKALDHHTAVLVAALRHALIEHSRP